MTDLHHSRDSGAELAAWLRAHPEEGTIKQLGEKLGINYSALRHYFAGHSFPRGEALSKLRQATQLPILERPPPFRAHSSRQEVLVPRTPGERDDGQSQPSHRSESPDWGADPRRFRFIVALRTWIGQHPETGRSGLAVVLGVSDSTVQEWVTGRYYPKPKLQRDISRVTGITFGPEGPTLPVAGIAPSPRIYETEVQVVAEALLEVLRVLQPVVQGPPARRKALQQAFSREGAGYLTAALTALYSSEEDFQTWKYFAHPITGGSK